MNATEQQKRIAIVFDFDDTLLPDSTTAAIQALGLDDRHFWPTVDQKVAQGWDPTLAWMDEFVRSPLFDNVTTSWLAEHGRDLETTLYPGVDSLFAGLRKHGERVGADVSLHVVSSGLEPVIRGCRPVAQQLDTVHACTFAYDETGRPIAVKRALTFTEKTRCLFEISKGITPSDAARAPYSVNEKTTSFAAPLSNMIFVGDGLTDVPAFSLLKQHGGIAVGVNKHGRNSHLLHDARVEVLADPDYRTGSPMRSHLEQSITAITERPSHPEVAA